MNLCDLIQTYGEHGCPYYNLMLCNLFDEVDNDSIGMLDLKVKGRFDTHPTFLANHIIEIERELNIEI